jgi:hypothetical protein
MSTGLTNWERSRFEPGGNNAMVLFAIYGSFANYKAISGTTYRTAGVPPGVDLRRFSRAKHPSLPFAGGEPASLLGRSNADLLARIERAPECLVIQGEVADPANLNYLRDCVGLVTFLLDHGGVAVADVPQLKFLERPEWRRDFFEPAKPRVHRHVSILFSEEETGTGFWYHTRGLRKFGRPDLSLHHVPERCQEAAIDLCNRLIELQAEGGRIREGQDINVSGLPGGLVCHHQGSIEDPDFNNVHVEIQFPPGQ